MFNKNQLTFFFLRRRIIKTKQKPRLKQIIIINYTRQRYKSSTIEYHSKTFVQSVAYSK